MFLDREPYIRFWRPFYFRYGGTIRRVKSMFSGAPGGSPTTTQIEQRLSSIEAQNQQIAAALEQLLLAVINDRRFDSVTPLDKTLTDRLSEHTAQITAANAAQWQAIEGLLIAAIGSSGRQSLAAELMYEPPGSTTDADPADAQIDRKPRS